MQLNRVVIGVDFSPASRTAASWVAKRFAPDADLVLTHVVALPEAPPILQGRFARREDLLETLRAGACTRLEDFGNSLGRQRVQLEVRTGDPVECLTLAAREHDAGLIVMGPHGDRPGVWEGLGSVVEHLVRSSPVPVLIARGALERAPQTFLVAVDDWRESMESLRSASALAQATSARLTVMHVVRNTGVASALAAAATVTGAPPVDTRDPAVAMSALSHLAEAMRLAGIPADHAVSDVAFGNPVEELLSAANRLHADLLILERREEGRIRRALLGSVINELLRKAPCPVLVVPGAHRDG